MGNIAGAAVESLIILRKGFLLCATWIHTPAQGTQHIISIL